MDNLSFTPDERTPYVGIVILVLLILLYNYSKGFKEFFSPLTIIAIIYGYYCCLGPYQAVTTGDTYDRLQNMRPYYVSALWGGLVSLLAYALGFIFNPKSRVFRLQPLPTDALFSYGIKTYVIGFVLFTISTGGNVSKLINPLDAQYVGQISSGLVNYLALSLNFLIPASTLLFAYVIITRKKFLWFLIPFILAMGLFITMGFRYRIVLLLGAMAITYYYLSRKKPNIIFAAGATFALIVFMGILNISRNYGSGLSTEKLEDGNSQTYYASGVREALIFQTSGAVIDIVPEKHPHAGFQPILSTLIMPIPRRFFPEKNSSDYLFDTLDAIYGRDVSQGAAMMAYGEYYLAFGWLGIVVGCFLTGWIFKNLWVWYKANWTHPYAIIAYALTAPYLYVIISRGYFPQVTMLFFFTIFPIYLIIWLAKKKYPFRFFRRTAVNKNADHPYRPQPGAN